MAKISFLLFTSAHFRTLIFLLLLESSVELVLLLLQEYIYKNIFYRSIHI